MKTIQRLRYIHDISVPYECMCSCSVVVITCTLHAQGPQFDPGQERTPASTMTLLQRCQNVSERLPQRRATRLCER